MLWEATVVPGLDLPLSQPLVLTLSTEKSISLFCKIR